MLERLMLALGLFVEATAEPRAHLIEPFIERAGEMLLAACGLIGEAPELACHFGKSECEFAGAAHGLETFSTLLAMAAPCEDGARDDQEKSQRRTGKQDLPKV